MNKIVEWILLLISFGFCVTNISWERKVNTTNYITDVPQYVQVFEKEGFSYIWQRRRLEQNESYDDEDDDGIIDINSNMSISCPFNSNNNNDVWIIKNVRTEIVMLLYAQ